jgi:endogenous inhibitor of DNA gyrase (YacG/DUF329 family)
VPSVKKVACPACGTLAAYGPENRWRPFCSERCKTIDLGDWASERYRVATEEPEELPSEGEGKSDDPA